MEHPLIEIIKWSVITVVPILLIFIACHNAPSKPKKPDVDE
jgi:hypothetical protein